MKKLYLITVLLLIGAHIDLHSQCADDNSEFTAPGLLTPSGPGLVNRGYYDQGWGGDMYTINVIAGKTYTFSTCGYDNTMDTYLTLYSSAPANTMLAFNNNACGNQSEITWVATYTGTVRLLLDGGTCNNYATNTDIWCAYTEPCVPPAVSSHPSNSTVCSGNNTSFSVSATGSSISYQWQVNTGSGFTNLSNNATYSNVNGNALAITGVTPSMNGYLYRCIVSGCSTPATSNSAILTVNSTPSTPGTISGSSPVCSGTSNTYTFTTVPGATAYNWTLPSGWAGSSISNSINATAGTASGTISVTASNTCGTSASSVLTVNVNSIPSTPGTISGPTPVCSGTSNTYTITTVPGATAYNWTLPSGWPGSSATNSINATAGTSSGNISVTASNACGTSASSVLTVNVNSNPSTPGTISGPTPVCAGTSNTYSVSTVPGATSYNWTLPSGWSGTSTLSSINATAGTLGGNISITASNTCGTSSPSVLPLTISSLPAITSNPSNYFLCEGQNGGFSTSSSTLGVTYQWQVHTGLGGFNNVINGGTYSGANTPSLNLTSVPAYMDLYRYVCVITNECGSVTTPEAILSVAETDGPNIFISINSGSSTICPGNTITFFAAISNAGVSPSYQWMVNGNPVGPNNPFFGYSSFNDGDVVTCMVTSSAPCASPNTALSNPITITVQSHPTITSHPSNTTVCANSNTNYTVGASGSGLVYQWQVNSGAGFVNLTNTPPYSGVNTSSLQITNATAGMSGYIYHCAVSGACSPAAVSNNATLTVNTIPATPGLINGSSITCAGNTESYNISSVPGATLYNWILPSGWSGTSSTTTINTITTNNDSLISVSASNVCGSSAYSTLPINVFPVYNENISATICNDDSYILGTQTLTLTGSYTENFTSVNGCDSIVNLNLLVNDTSETVLNITACNFYILNTFTYTSTGTYQQHFTNSLGCDSVVTIHLIINDPDSVDLNITECSSYTLNTTTYTSTGIYHQNFTNASGCDSVITLHLIINEPDSVDLNVTECSSYTLNTTTYTSTGIYYQNFINTSGCDSTITLHLVINYPDTVNLVVSSCHSFTLNSETFYASGIYYQDFTNIYGCDSILEIDLHIDTLSINVTQTGYTFTAVPAPGATYQWVDCIDGNIPGATNNSYTATENGSYAVIMTSGVCTGTSNCFDIVNMYIESENSTDLFIYPNPTEDMIYVNLSSGNISGYYTIIDGLGKIVLSGNYTNTNFSIDINQLRTGTYFLTIHNGEKSMAVRFIKK